MAMRRLLVFVLFLNALLVMCNWVAEAQTVAIQVSDVHDHPLPGAILSAKGNGSTSAPTDKAGKTQVSLSSKQPGDEMALILVTPKSPMRIFSPWEGRGTVPKPSGFVEIVVGRAGDMAALNNSSVIWSMAAAVVETKDKSPTATYPSGEQALRQIASEAGLDPRAVDAAIREEISIEKIGGLHLPSGGSCDMKMSVEGPHGVAKEYLRYVPKPISEQ